MNFIKPFDEECNFLMLIFNYYVIYLIKKIFSFIFHRHGCLQEWIKKFEESEGGIENFTKGYEYYGIQVLEDNTVVAREWAPGAIQLYLTGDFSEFYFNHKVHQVI